MFLAVCVCVAQRRVTLSDPDVADPRQTAFYDLVHIQADLRRPEVVLTFQGENNFKKQIKYVDVEAVLVNGMVIKPAITDGTDITNFMFPAARLRTIMDMVVSRGDLVGTVDP